MFKIVVYSEQLREPNGNEFIISDEYVKKVVLLFGLIPVFVREFVFSSVCEEESEKSKRKNNIGFRSANE